MIFFFCPTSSPCNPRERESLFFFFGGGVGGGGICRRISQECFPGLFTGHDPGPRVGSECFQKLVGRVGSGRVSQEVFHVSPVGTGRVRKYSKNSRAGLGHLDPTRPVHGIPTREMPWCFPPVFDGRTNCYGRQRNVFQQRS